MGVRMAVLYCPFCKKEREHVLDEDPKWTMCNSCAFPARRKEGYMEGKTSYYKEI